MARMRAISMTVWGEDGIQVSFQMVPNIGSGRFEVNHTEMALPDNKTEFARLLAIRLYEQFDISLDKVPTPTT